MFRRFSTLVALALVVSIAGAFAGQNAEGRLSFEPVPKKLQVSKLFVKLDPALVATPDGMAIAPDGDLVVACPNFGNQKLPGVIIKIDKNGNVKKWFDVPVNPASGVARPMGIDFDEWGNLYIVDNQGWTGNPESVNQGRILKVFFDRQGNPVRTVTIATGMEHPNGIKYRDGFVYVTQSCFSEIKDPSGKLVSGVYRFPADAINIRITNTIEDQSIIALFITENMDIQYGLDGLLFDHAGNLYVGNFGDGSIHKITFDTNGNVNHSYTWAQDNDQLLVTDGMCIDDYDGTIYVADFNANAIAMVAPDGVITRIAQSPDSNGANGELDQPGEPIVWNGKLIVTCFDMVTDPGKANSSHDEPHTIVSIDIY